MTDCEILAMAAYRLCVERKMAGDVEGTERAWTLVETNHNEGLRLRNSDTLSE